MITNAPLPGWRDLWRALVHRPLSAGELAKPWCRPGDVAGWLSRSAWSLALIVIWRQRLQAKATPVVWIPDYFCNSSLMAVRALGVRLVFYPVNKAMQPDMVACRILAGENCPDIFLLVHYFGRPAVTALQREFCATLGAWLVEDAAHVLRPLSDVGVAGDFVIYSPHKTLALPDGAVLVARAGGPSALGFGVISSLGRPEGWAGQLSDVQLKMQGLVTNCGRHAGIWLIKRVLQKLGFGTGRKRLPRSTNPQDSAADVSHTMIGPEVSCIAKRLLPWVSADLDGVARLRQRHELLWDALVTDRRRTEVSDLPLPLERPVARSWTPYLAAYEGNESSIREIARTWGVSGMPVLTWPDLPPEVISNQDAHVEAHKLGCTRVYLPVHQSLSTRDLYSVKAGTFLAVLPRSLELVWNQASEEDWKMWTAKAGRSNLLQSWAYGEAKKDESGWAVQRGVFYAVGQVVAIVQVLQRSFGGVIQISRINRGPLFLNETAAEDRYTVLAVLGKNLANLWRGKLLSMAPELEIFGVNLGVLERLKFRQFSSQAWESIWVDLEEDVEILRRKLDGKWRNALVFSEKAGLTLEVGTDNNLFEWMMARYQELMQEKGFSGSPVSLLLALRKKLGEVSPPLIFRALQGTRAVAGICIVPHGVCATYLVGWNSSSGRDLKANQYLLWNAMKYLKNYGYRWFDLGGIDEKRTPGIAAFKLGINGRRYETVGEYWKW